ncbi:MAG: peptide-N-glycosidase F-related protein [Planctomycetota bacterium]|nr:peptide-N-glycosidase F-related protein [Planctomycetota bacterium]
MRVARLLLLISLLVGAGLPAHAEDEPVGPSYHLAQFGAGGGPRATDGRFGLLDEAWTKGQSNAVAFEPAFEGPRATVKLACRLRVHAGGDGGAFVFLNTSAFGVRGPAPFVPSWVEPNLRGSFAVGVDVHNPPSPEMFSPWGNYADLPQREISLHFDGREIVKRVAPAEFRGAVSEFVVELVHVVGGAEVSVAVAGAPVYERYFIPRLAPYPMRLAIGAGTRADAATVFDVDSIRFEGGEAATPARPPLHVEVFNHVLTNNAKTFFEKPLALPPEGWAFGRVILTLDIHDAGNDWDEWDRNGEVYVVTADGTKLAIVPFITSYRTPCHWEVDVTHFRPLLTGACTLGVAAGTTFYKNRGYMLSITLDFHHGTPALEPYQVEPLWHGSAHYRSEENRFRDFFTPRAVTIPAEAAAARVFMTTTGHSQVGEFTPCTRTVVFQPGEDAEPQRFENRLWKTDVYLNPNRPQFGTWQYARAGWAPGDLVHPWWIDLTPHVQPGAVAELRYEPGPYEFEQVPPAKDVAAASQVVHSYLVLYRQPEWRTPAPTLLVTSVDGNSAAAQAGVQAGDYLAQYNGRRLDTVEDLRAAIGGAAASETPLPIVVYRGTQRLEFAIAPGRMGVSLGTR